MFFFFSSRRRHTRSTRDWSSDVCSSDLSLLGHIAQDDDLDAVGRCPTQLDGPLRSVLAGEGDHDRIRARALLAPLVEYGNLLLPGAEQGGEPGIERGKLALAVTGERFRCLVDVEVRVAHEDRRH